jgi:hypothetical protein
LNALHELTETHDQSCLITFFLYFIYLFVASQLQNFIYLFFASQLRNFIYLFIYFCFAATKKTAPEDDIATVLRHPEKEKSV